MFYWCYGSNLNQRQMAIRCPGAQPLGAAYLDDYTLKFKGFSTWGGGVATVEPLPGGVVPGGLWEITDECLVALDRYEGYPRLYDRRNVTVQLPEGGSVEAMTYYMVTGRESVPSGMYLRCIMEGYNDFGLDVRVLKNACRRR